MSRMPKRPKRKPTPTKPAPATGQRETGWKIWTHDRRPPVQGGEPVWDGSLPFDLPTVTLDTSESDCGNGGWHYSRELKDAIRIAGLWPLGRPSLVTLVEPAADVLHRGDKSRASTLRLLRVATEAEVRQGIEALSTVFAPHADVMVEEQLAWRAALARPRRDEAAVASGLIAALQARGLKWSLERIPTTKAAWDAWAAWAARDARDAWAAWAARDARDAWAAWAAWAARDAWAAWAARAAWDAWAAWAAWAARDALTLGFASRQSWVKDPPDMLTVGVRDAYENGLELAIPVGPDKLGWVMAEGDGA